MKGSNILLFDSRIFDEKRFINEDPLSGEQLWFVPRNSFYMKGFWSLYNNAVGHDLTPKKVASHAGGKYETADTFDNEGCYFCGSSSEVDDMILSGVYGRDNCGGENNKARFMTFLNSNK